MLNWTGKPGHKAKRGYQMKETKMAATCCAVTELGEMYFCCLNQAFISDPDM